MKVHGQATPHVAYESTPLTGYNSKVSKINSFPTIEAEYCAKCGKRVDFGELYIYNGFAYHRECLPRVAREFVESDNNEV